MTSDKPDSNADSINLDSISQLVPRIKSGCSESRDKLLLQIQDYVQLMATKKTSTHLQGKFGASDVAQQSMAQVVKGFEHFRGSSTPEFYAWLQQIITNEARRLHRDFHRDKRNVKLEQPLANERSGDLPGFVVTDKQPTPGSMAIAAEQIERLHHVLDQLPDDYAEVIRLRSLELLPFKEVAERMERSVDSVSKLWYRAVLRLQQKFEPNDESAQQE